MDVRVLPVQTPRVETGPTQFGDDWPGIFIRGDNAFAYALALEYLLSEDTQPDPLSDVVHRSTAEGLIRELRSCICS